MSRSKNKKLKTVSGLPFVLEMQFHIVVVVGVKIKLKTVSGLPFVPSRAEMQFHVANVSSRKKSCHDREVR